MYWVNYILIETVEKLKITLNKLQWWKKYSETLLQYKLQYHNVKTHHHKLYIQNSPYRSIIRKLYLKH